MLVKIDIIGLNTLVESFLIPKPASTITESTGCTSPKYKNIIVVIISNSVALPNSVSTSNASLIGLTRVTNSIISSFEIGYPFKLIRSLKVSINGDVKVPTS